MTPDPSPLPWRKARLLGIILATLQAVAALAQDVWPDTPVASSHDLFPLNMISLGYRPAGARPIGEGRLQTSLQVIRGNIFEFSDPIKDFLVQRIQGGKIQLTPATVTQFARDHADQPMLFFFDGEVQRTELGLRLGLSPDTDLQMTLAWQGISGGYLDPLIDGFHRLGFQQTGRSQFPENQLTMVIIEKGQVRFFTQTPVRDRPVDPELTLVRALCQTQSLATSVLATLQFPTTRWAGSYRSDWDASLGLALKWEPADMDLAVDAGTAYLRRSKLLANPSPFFLKDQVAGHLAFELRGWDRVHPYLMLVGVSGLTGPEPGNKLNRPSLCHDLGVHVRTGSHSVFTFGYINNITHNENTADMEFSARLSVTTP